MIDYPDPRNVVVVCCHFYHRSIDRGGAHDGEVYCHVCNRYVVEIPNGQFIQGGPIHDIHSVSNQ